MIPLNLKFIEDSNKILLGDGVGEKVGEIRDTQLYNYSYFYL